MTPDAMGLRSVVGRDAVTAQEVDLARDRLKVVLAKAGAISAEVVKVKTGGHGAVRQLPEGAMRLGLADRPVTL